MIIDGIDQPYPSVEFEDENALIAVLEFGKYLLKTTRQRVSVPDPSTNMADFVSGYFYVYSRVYDALENEDSVDGIDAMVFCEFNRVRRNSDPETLQSIDKGMRYMFGLDDSLHRHKLDGDEPIGSFVFSVKDSKGNYLYEDSGEDDSMGYV